MSLTLFWVSCKVCSRSFQVSLWVVLCSFLVVWSLCSWWFGVLGLSSSMFACCVAVFTVVWTAFGSCRIRLKRLKSRGSTQTSTTIVQSIDVAVAWLSGMFIRFVFQLFFLSGSGPFKNQPKGVHRLCSPQFQVSLMKNASTISSNYVHLGFKCFCPPKVSRSSLRKGHALHLNKGCVPKRATQVHLRKL